jgi:hypothetical protein
VKDLQCHNSPGIQMVRNMRFGARYDLRGETASLTFEARTGLTRVALSRSKLLASVEALSSLEQGLYHRRVIDQLRLFHFETIARAGILGIALKSGASLRRSVVQRNWFHLAAISRVYIFQQTASALSVRS